MAGRSGRIWLALALVALALVLAAATAKPREAVLVARGLLVAASAPFTGAVREATDWLAGVVDTLVALRDLPARNRALESELAAMRRLAIEAEELRQENEALRALLRLRESGPPEFRAGLAARVVGRSPDRWYDEVTVDRGADDGVARGMAVVTPEGLVGRVVQVTAREAVVLLLTNPDSGVGALVQRETSRAEGVVLGQAASRGLLTMQFFSPDADAVPGDVVITSGLGGTFPRGIAVGYVVSVARGEEGLALTAQIEPAADLDRLEWVMIVP
ncbi:MAG: rod shape-determining protein MreC [Clostridia bacterium]|nr:rod shape-determining protein MreC [Clostridia bacterium]